MSIIDLDRDYSPSMWTKRFESSDEVINHFISFGRESMLKTMLNLKVELLKKNIF